MAKLSKKLPKKTRYLVINGIRRKCTWNYANKRWSCLKLKGKGFIHVEGD